MTAWWSAYWVPLAVALLFGPRITRWFWRVVPGEALRRGPIQRPTGRAWRQP